MKMHRSNFPSLQLPVATSVSEWTSPLGQRKRINHSLTLVATKALPGDSATQQTEALPNDAMETHRGATLIELLVAIAMMAMLMTALLSFVFSMTEIWGQGGEKRLFDQHVNAVTRHLESMMRRAALPTAGLASEEAFTFSEVSPSRAGKINGLTFILPGGDRLMQWDGSPAPFAEVTLGIDSQQGLMLYWRSQLEEEEDEWRETAVTPFLDALRFVYFDVDTKRWSTESAPQRNREGLWRVPERLILQFEHGDLKAERTITLPLAIGGQPIL